MLGHNKKLNFSSFIITVLIDLIAVPIEIIAVLINLIAVSIEIIAVLKICISQNTCFIFALIKVFFLIFLLFLDG